MRALPFALVIASLAAPTLAAASPGYPRALANANWAPMAPDCTLCHVADITSYDSVRTPFGRSLRARGLIAGDVTSLYNAMNDLERDKVDSDADGTPDTVELANGDDPNAPGSQPLREPHFGCAVHAGSPSAWPLAAVALAVAVSLGRRRRAAHAPRR